MSGICVILEQRGGEAKRASIEALAEALRNKDALGGSVTAVLIGSGMTARVRASMDAPRTRSGRRRSSAPQTARRRGSTPPASLP